MDLGLRQMNEQIADTPVQDVVQGEPDLGHGVDVEPAGDSDLLPEDDLGHARRPPPHASQSHVSPHAPVSRPDPARSRAPYLDASRCCDMGLSRVTIG